MKLKLKRQGKLLAILLLVINFMSSVSIIFAQSDNSSYSIPTQNILERKADTPTLYDYRDILNYSNKYNSQYGTRYSGRVWNDKSVFANTGENAQIIGLDNYDNIPIKNVDGTDFTGYGDITSNEDFLEVFSTVGSSQNTTITNNPAVDIMFVLDLSGSMGAFTSGNEVDVTTDNYASSETTNKRRIGASVNAINAAISALIDMNPANRIGVIGFANRAQEILPLSSYQKGSDYINISDIKYYGENYYNEATTPGSTNYEKYQGYMCYQISVNATSINKDGNIDQNFSGVMLETGSGNWNTDKGWLQSKYYNQDYVGNNEFGVNTNLQSGLYMALNQLANADPTEDTNIGGKNRIPLLITLTDGQANRTLTWTNYDNFYSGDPSIGYWWEVNNNSKFIDKENASENDYYFPPKPVNTNLNSQENLMNLYNQESDIYSSHSNMDGGLSNFYNTFTGSYAPKVYNDTSYSAKSPLFYTNGSTSSETILDTLLSASLMKANVLTNYGITIDEKGNLPEEANFIYNIGIGYDINTAPKSAQAMLNPSLYFTEKTEPKDIPTSSNTTSEMLAYYFAWNAWFGDAYYVSNESSPTIQNLKKDAINLGSMNVGKGNNPTNTQNYLARNKGLNYINANFAPYNGSYTGNSKNLKVDISLFEHVMDNGYTNYYENTNTSDDILGGLSQILSETIGTFSPISGGGTSSTESSETLTYQDPVGQFMEVKKIEGLYLFGESYEVKQNDDDYYIVDKDGNSDFTITNPVYEYTETEDISEFSPTFNSREIKLSVTDDATTNQQILNITIPAAALPLLDNTIQLTYTNGFGPGVTANTIDYKDNAYSVGSLPLRVVYSTGLANKYLNPDETVNLNEIEALDPNYITNNIDENNSKVYFYSNYYNPENSVTVNGEKETRGSASFAFSPNPNNRFYIFQKNLPIYTGELAEKYPEQFASIDANGIPASSLEGFNPENIQENVNFLINTPITEDNFSYSSEENYYIIVEFYTPTDNAANPSNDFVAAEKTYWILPRTTKQLMESGLVYWNYQDEGNSVQSPAVIFETEDLENLGPIYQIPPSDVTNYILATAKGGWRIDEVDNYAIIKNNNPYLNLDDNSENNVTNTASLLYYPTFDGIADSAIEFETTPDITAYAGNNGRLTVSLPNLVISKDQKVNDGLYTSDEMIVTTGDIVTYRLTLRNDTEANMADITVVDKLPNINPRLIVDESSITPNGIYNDTNQTITWTGINLEAGETFELIFSVTVPETKEKISWTNIATANDIESNETTITTQPQSTGSLAVTKTITGISSNPNKFFNFVVTLSDKTINGTYGTMTFNNGIATFALSNGHCTVATGLPSGIYYVVSETEANMFGYTTTASGTMGVIPVAATAFASFTNTNDIEYGSLIVQKQMAMGAATNESFDFIATFTNPDGTLLSGEIMYILDNENITHAALLTNGQCRFSLTPNSSIIFSHLPVGTKYYLQEIDTGNYEVTWINQTGQISSVMPKAVAINTPVQNETGSLTVLKTIATDDIQGEFNFLVTFTDQNNLPLTDTITYIHGTTMDTLTLNNGQGNFTLTPGDSITFIDLPFGVNYIVEEINVEGYIVTWHNDKGTINSANITAIALNTKEEQNNGTLTVIKDAPEATPEENFDFIITFTDANGNFLEGTIKYNLNNSSDIIEASLNDGQYIFSLKPNTSITFVEVPYNTNYSLEEINLEIYEVTWSNQTGTINEDNQQLAAVAYNKLKDTTDTHPPQVTDKVFFKKQQSVNNNIMTSDYVEYVSEDTITYYLTVTNNNSSTITNVSITDKIPNGLLLVEGSISNEGIYDSNTRTITWEIESINPRDSVTVLFNTKIPNDIVSGTYFINTATLTFEIDSEDFTIGSNQTVAGNTAEIPETPPTNSPNNSMKPNGSTSNTVTNTTHTVQNTIFSPKTGISSNTISYIAIIIIALIILGGLYVYKKRIIK